MINLEVFLIIATADKQVTYITSLKRYNAYCDFVSLRTFLIYAQRHILSIIYVYECKPTGETGNTYPIATKLWSTQQYFKRQSIDLKKNVPKEKKFHTEFTQSAIPYIYAPPHWAADALVLQWFISFDFTTQL